MSKQTLLKLTVRKDSKIYINTPEGEVVISVEMLSKEQGRLSFEAPNSVSILRQEVRERNRIEDRHDNRGNV